jgi:carbamoyltransferase
MNILSFQFFGGCHDTAAAIVCDGVLVAAAEEERFSRRKHDGTLPVRAIDFCLRHAGLRMNQVDIIAFPDKPFRTGPDSEHPETDFDCLRQLRAAGIIRARSLLHKRLLDFYLPAHLPSFNWQMNPMVASGFATLREHYPNIPPVRYYGHHLAHAAAAYLTSGHDKAAIATIDGRGGSLATATWRAHGIRIRRLRAAPYIYSLGIFYDNCTEYLGLREFGEGKTMGLAPYGDREVYGDRVSSLLDCLDSDWYRYRARPSAQILGFPPRGQESILQAPYTDFAAAVQHALERAVQRVVESAMEEAKTRTLCLGGGVMLNCSSNGKLLESGIASSIHVFPASNDAGLSIGAALLCAAEAGEFYPMKLDHAYWGPSFNPTEYKAALRGESQVVYQRASNLAHEVAAHLADGQVVGWFQGRMELGPRALGNRSLLADPRTAAMRDRVNTLKGRELWRPLAPVVVAEHASEFFALSAPSPFMLFATQVRAEKRSSIPAVVHIDGSARPQTVTRTQNAAKPTS